MSKIVRVGVTFPPELLKELDEIINKMGYQSRKRNYKSRRERNAATWRNFRTILIFLIIVGAVLIIKNRVAIWDWFRLLFY